MTENIEETTNEEIAKSELQKSQREVDRDCSVNDRATETAGAWVPEWADEWIAEFLPNHTSLKKDSE
jgi:hypothetical protein